MEHMMVFCCSITMMWLASTALINCRVLRGLDIKRKIKYFVLAHFLAAILCFVALVGHIAVSNYYSVPLPANWLAGPITFSLGFGPVIQVIVYCICRR